MGKRQNNRMKKNFFEEQKQKERTTRKTIHI